MEEWGFAAGDEVLLRHNEFPLINIKHSTKQCRNNRSYFSREKQNIHNNTALPMSFAMMMGIIFKVDVTSLK